jgi:malate dehydrogenase (oxaloacetate-decarboxylating)(NADP+)
VLATRSTRVTDDMYFAAAQALAAQVTSEDLAAGRVFPPAARMRQVALAVATAVAEVAYESRLATVPRPPDIEAHIRRSMYAGDYPDRPASPQ